MNAKDILIKAVQCDKEGRILEAQSLYQDGIQILMDVVADETDAAKKKVYYERIKEYIDRAEQIKIRVQKHAETGEIVANIPIDENSCGHSYRSLFGKYLNTDVKEILLDEPYLTERYQFQNLLAFAELAVKQSKNLKYIRLITKPDSKNPDGQAAILKQIKDDLAKREITLTIKYEPSLHDRKIVLSNGYIIKIGRGLHFFKAISPLYSLGLCDYDFRKCLQTDVDIWRTKNFS
ncbi:MIT domain-containing protein 1 [Stomoxys calcitrans]|uniref:MIT domain-containing protein n=1 Tax=Stomoxys calcitrans TaxID=35570 RepID=A0A1I8PLF4_STOCA|nr:MIT domain-containing protein 1 [Stomoxys calcitrans]